MEAKSIMLSGFLLTLLFLGGTYAQDNALPNSEQIKQGVDKLISNTDFNSTLGKAEDAFLKKCQNVAKEKAQEVFQKSKDARTVLETCFKTNVNMTELQAEMELARPKGALDEVFKKYCDRKTALQRCLTDYTATLEPCLTSSEIDNLRVVHNVTEQLASFICYKDGDRIALFIAEKGPECLTEKNDKIQECVQNYTSVHQFNYINASNINVDDFDQFNLEFNDDTCKQMSNLKDCVVTQLVTCSEPTPSNIADALFKYIRKATPCGDMAPSGTKAKQTGTPSSASMVSAATALLTAVAALALF